MIDSMTRDDVLSALGEISKHFESCTKETYGSTCELFHRWMNAADWAAAYLNDPAPTVGGWISVKDRLPDKNEKIVICYEWTGLFSGDKYREVTVGTIADLGPECFVIAWMSLPEPPEEDANGESKI